MKKILSVILIVLLFASFYGCGESQTQKEERLTVEATQSIEKAFSHLENSELKKFCDYTDPDEFKSMVNLYFKDYLEVYEYDELMEEWLPNVSCRLESMNYVDDNTMTATVTVTAPDRYAEYLYKYEEMSKMAQNFIDTAYTGKSNYTITTESYIKRAFEKVLNYNTISTTIDIEVIKKDGSWEFVMSDQLGNAFCGDLTGAGQRIDEDFAKTGTSREKLDRMFYEALEKTAMIYEGYY